MISERGRNSSEWQRQRLVLGAWGTCSASLLLDELPSALDAANEGRAIEYASPDACMIAPTPMQNLLERFNTVVLMQGGHRQDTWQRNVILGRQPVLQNMVGPVERG